MCQPHVDDCVRLMRDIPELSLQRGQVGVVRSTWCAPYTAYEVEFHAVGLDSETRALVMAEELQLAESSGEESLGR
jgi:hypothetical protein